MKCILRAIYFRVGLVACLLTFSFPFSFGQIENQKKSSVFLELGGSGGLGSLNFEHHFLKKRMVEFTWRAGFSIAPVDKNNGFGLVFPIMASALVGKSAHKLEVGLGQGITLTTKGKFFILGTAIAGYRYQHEDKKIFFRAGYTPLISYLIDFQVQHWFGLSMGYTFSHTTK